ncbi:hypothetical protein R6V09_34495 [Streptomyces sp. W16]|uniref:hypothetical protein n=1 Tax=Streptomyces sp. W16 TaxID=3076631 RepID=UPI00295B14B8|nr:hypothetical protein [Streptomyces sp. W16]MDV9175208.1 hypothetical protein [Streptomyces sp. W16]
MALEGIEGAVLLDIDVERMVPHRCGVRVPHHQEEVFGALRQLGIGTHYPPNHLQPAFTA